MDDSVRKALSILDESYLKEYELKLSRIWRDVIHLNSNLYILGILEKFPFRLIDEYTSFWRIVYTSIYESSVLIIWRLLFDNRSNTQMNGLKNEIMQKIVDENYREKMKRDNRITLLEATKAKYRNKIEEVRHKRISHAKAAHFNWKLLPSFENYNGLKVEDLCNIQNSINDFFDLLSLTVLHSKWPDDYNPDIEYTTSLDQTTDIERLLLYLIKDNALVNMPEDQQPYWPHQRQNLSAKDIEIINQLRRSIGKPEVE